MMKSEEELRSAISEMVDKYSDQLPNYVQEPRRFMYYVNLYKWNIELKKYQFIPGIFKNE
jgi:hypothetical protein